jgi:6-phosphogluconolactonase
MLSIKKVLKGLIFIGSIIINSAFAGISFDEGAVFVMTNDVVDNEIAMFGRASNGTLQLFGKVSSGGKGSLTQPIDPLTYQSSIILTKDHKYLLVSNAGSSEISVFSVDGHELKLVDKVPSNGFHPISITINKSVVYVLNTGGDGSIAGFKLTEEGKLNSIPNSVRSLKLNGTIPPQVNDLNHQILFNPNGDRLVVSGGVKTNQLLVYGVDKNGLISDESVETNSSGSNPFSLLFSKQGSLVVAEAESTNALSSYRLNDDKTLSVITSSLHNGKSFSCWLVSNGNNYIYLINTGTDDISLYKTDQNGELNLVNATILTLGLGAIQTDTAFSSNGKYLYTLNGGKGTVGVIRVNTDDGKLNLVEEVGGLEANAFKGLQGIAAY